MRIDPTFATQLLATGASCMSWPLDRWAKRAHQVAATAGVYNGVPEQTGLVLRRCRWFHTKLGAMVIFTRDAGMHTSGWWKNPDYDKCLHLSLSFWDMESGQPRGFDGAEAGRIVTAFYQRDRKKLWAESPFSPDGKRIGVWHFRLFMKPDWSEGIIPKREVYTRDEIPSGWRSWSDVQADLACPDFGSELTDDHIEAAKKELPAP